MRPQAFTLAMLTLVLLLVAAGASHQKSAHATRHGSRARAAHRSKAAHSRAAPLARKATRVIHEPEPELITLKETNVIEFDFGGDGTLEQEVIASGRYDPKMIMPSDITLDNRQRNRIFVSTPLARGGTPATLCTIPYDGEINPRQTPYPNLEIHRTTEDTITDCNTQLVDVIRTAKTWADDDTLYVLDIGVLDLVAEQLHVCPPKIVVFDLRTDEVINTTVIEKTACNSYYNYFWVDACPDGGLTAYSSDSRGNVLTVTDLTTGTSKHLRSQYFHPKPGYFFISGGGPTYYFPDGVNGVTAEESCDGKVYFQSLASNTQGVVDKQVIRDASDGDVLDVYAQVALPGELPGASGVMAVDPAGQLLFFPIQDEMALYCWNTSKPHDPQNFRRIAQDSERLQFFTSLYQETETQRLYIVTNRLTNYVTNNTNYSEINYRILYIDIQDIKC